MSTPLSPPQHQNPRSDRQQELAALNDQFNLATGRKSKPSPWHKEPKLSKGKQEALDALEPQKKSGGFYKETEAMKKQQDAFDLALKNVKAPGTGTWQATPPTKKEKLLAWHKALGSPKHVVDAELAQLEQQEGKA
ncbi:MAG: hypothetical protein PHS80_02630 [Methanothrix sp.]|nr:hypothetical protein [Methanothrix sp.]